MAGLIYPTLVHGLYCLSNVQCCSNKSLALSQLSKIVLQPLDPQTLDFLWTAHWKMKSSRFRPTSHNSPFHQLLPKVPIICILSQPSIRSLNAISHLATSCHVSMRQMIQKLANSSLFLFSLLPTHFPAQIHPRIQLSTLPLKTSEPTVFPGLEPGTSHFAIPSII